MGTGARLIDLADDVESTLAEYQQEIREVIQRCREGKGTPDDWMTIELACGVSPLPSNAIVCSGTLPF